MKEKILAKLVALHPGLSKEVLGLVATFIANKVTDESGIDQAITDYDNTTPIKTLADEFQKEGDRRVTVAKKEFLKNPPKPDKTEKETPRKEEEATPKPDEAPAWAKSLIAEVQSLKIEKAQNSIREKIKDKLKDAKVPDKFYAKWALPEKEEDVDSFVQSITTDYTAFKQDMVNQGLMQETPPESSAGGSGAKKEASDELVDAVFAKMN